MKFLYELLHSGRARESAPDFDDRCRLVRSVCLEKFGPRIVDSLVRSSIFALPAYTYHDVGDVIFEIMLLDRAQVSSRRFISIHIFRFSCRCTEG